MAHPRLSVGLPVYNGERFLEQALESLLSQDFEDFELIISDNASTDATSSICQDFAAQDRRVHYHRFATNEGAIRNINHVFALSRGEFFKWAAHDDICLPGFYRRCIEVFEAEPPSVVLVYPRTQFIDENDKPLPGVSECLELQEGLPHRRLAHVLNRLSRVCAQYGVIRSEALRKTQLHPRFTAGDFLLMAELAILGEFREIPELLFQRRIHAEMSSKANRNWASLQAWHDPTLRHWMPVPPMMRLGLEYLKSIRRLPMPEAERWKCYLTAVGTWYCRQFRIWGGRHKRKLLGRSSVDG